MPVSVGLDVLTVGSGSPMLSEVSIVRRGAVEGACIMSRYELKCDPVKPKSAAPPARSKTAVPTAGEVFYGSGRFGVGVIKRSGDHDTAWMQELERRMDWLERRTGRQADMEIVLRDMQREVNGPTIDELYAETIGRGVRRVAA